MKVKLIRIDRWSPVWEFTLERLPAVIGRNRNADIAIDDRWISPRHGELSEIDSRLGVRDLQSAHGTLKNGRPVRDSVFRSGDTLTIGNRRFRVTYRESDDARDATWRTGVESSLLEVE
jgi:pSer/pThr/pTyr-binding forkhead associated (FHA) protein